MHVNENSWAENHVEMRVLEVSTDQDSSYATRIAVPSGTQKTLVLVEQTDGTGKVDIEGVDADNASRYRRVKVFYGAVKRKTKSIGVALKLGADSTVKVTVMFFKKQLQAARKDFSCKVCKRGCKALVSVAMAHFGIPYLDVDESIEMPGIFEPNLTTGPQRGIEEILEGDIDNPISVDIGEPLHLKLDNNFASLDEFLLAASDQSWLGELFNDFHPTIKGAVRAALEATNWFFSGTDKLYTQVCTTLRCCKPATSAVS